MSDFLSPLYKMQETNQKDISCSITGALLAGELFYDSAATATTVTETLLDGADPIHSAKFERVKLVALILEATMEDPA